ncbi:MAG: hypothetical protein HY201_05555, partial [Nitrospirae bacterium]|nr:hypothetical protein [Candidatus Troglogloeales bacterium]
MRKMKISILWLFLLIASFPRSVWAGDDIASVGDALQYLLPAAAFGTTLFHHDLPGALQFG